MIEARSILAGRAADSYATRDRFIPYWAWLNTLAHRPPRSLRSVATAYPFGALTRTTIEIADELDRVSAVDALAIQTAVFLPAELNVLAGGDDSPSALLQAVRRHVERSNRHAHRS